MKTLMLIRSFILFVLLFYCATLNAEYSSVRLISAFPTIDTGPITSPLDAKAYTGTSVIFDFKPGDSAFISSSPDGLGWIVIDNFLKINGLNACEGVPEQSYPDSCFGLELLDPLANDVEGIPIHLVLSPIPPIDISALIPIGVSALAFELVDYGGIAGNTELYLVTTAKMQPDGSVTTLYEQALQLLKSKFGASVASKFRTEFDAQVIDVVESKLVKEGVAPDKINEFKATLVELRNRNMREACAVVDAYIDSAAQLSKARHVVEIEKEAPPVPFNVITHTLIPDMGSLNFDLNQTAKHIVKFGIQEEKLTYKWRALSGELIIEPDVGTAPLPSTLPRVVPKLDIDVVRRPRQIVSDSEIRVSGEIDVNTPVAGRTRVVPVRGEVRVSRTRTAVTRITRQPSRVVD